LAIATTLFVLFIVNITALPEVVIDIAIGALIIFSISVIDDIKHVPSILRLGFHLSAAGWLVYAGLGLNSVILPGGGEIILSKPVSWLLTILFVTWMTNLFNFMDGMDGFAGGMTVIGFSVLAFVFFKLSDYSYGIHYYSYRNTGIPGFQFSASKNIYGRFRFFITWIFCSRPDADRRQN